MNVRRLPGLGEQPTLSDDGRHGDDDAADADNIEGSGTGEALARALDGAVKIRGGAPRVAIIPCLHTALSRRVDFNARRFAEEHTIAMAQVLRRVPDLHVVAAFSTSRRSLKRLVKNLGDERKAMMALAKQLDVDYLLVGDLFSAEQDLRFEHGLYDGRTGERLSFNPVDMCLHGLYGYNDMIVERMAPGILSSLKAASMAMALETPDSAASSFALTVKAQREMHGLDASSLRRADRLLARALRHNPKNATALALRGRIRSLRWGQGGTKLPKLTAWRARLFAKAALRLDQRNAIALSVQGHVATFLFRKLDVGHKYLREAVAACPNEPSAWMLLAATLAFLGEADEARRHAEFALSLTPRDPHLFNYQAIICLACYAQKDYDKGIWHARLSLRANPRYTAVMRLLAACHVGRGEITRAREVGQEMHRIEEKRFTRRRAEAIPYRDPLMRDLWIMHLERAGIIDPLPSENVEPDACDQVCEDQS